ncbi:MAG TPA: SIR2 family protein [Terriglobia bacterium]|nr:SIR2 family protein [Terriglobia bacterium]
MIDPLHSLAFSIQASPGVYAVLLGSGVSRSANIPTGWEITLDLVRKLATMKGESCDADPARWYRERFGKEPDYSELLRELAKTPDERRQLLHPYFQPSEEERAQGIKMPKAAHQAIARLAAKGYIRVIITTNFDRLIETALNDAGVVPTVVSTPDQAQGAMPLIHTRCFVFKVHGDYLDTRICNTPAELACYPKEFNNLLDRIFDEFGLIVCGWSAKWDTALRAAMERAKSRRFSYFWAVRAGPDDAAKRLIAHRGAQEIPIADADKFFSDLANLVEGLEQFARPHPLSKEAAVASLKNYLPDPQHRIRLDELISAEVDRVLEITSRPEFALQGGPAPDSKTFTDRVHAYEAACETLIAMAAEGGYWAEDWHFETWKTALTRLATERGDSGLIVWLYLQRYPATLLLYALGMGAVEAREQRLQFLGKLFATPIYGLAQQQLTEKTAVEWLSPFWLFEGNSSPAGLLEGIDRRFPTVGFNQELNKLLRPQFQRNIPHIAQFAYAFDRLEILIALSCAYHARSDSAFSPGLYIWRPHNCERFLKELRTSLENLGEKSPYVGSGIFGRTAAECMAWIGNFSSWVATARWS